MHVEPPPAHIEPPAPRFEPPALRVELPPAHVEPRVEPPTPRFDTPVPRAEPLVKSMPEMPPLASLVGDETEPVEPEMGEFAFKAAEEPAPPPPKKGSRVGWLIAIAVVLAVAAGLVWAVRTFLSGNVVRVVEAPAPAPKKSAEPAPAPAVPAPAAQAPVAEKPVPAPAKPAPAAAPVPKGKAALLLTPDWSGKSAVYVVHFSSHKDRPSAEKEARRLAGELGKPGRAVEVDLGEKGTWFRVVIGEFTSVEDARTFRADLEAKKMPGLGFVYEMRGR